jgi:Bifunctional DNA primase/polymerase, N-terminal/AAA domain
MTVQLAQAHALHERGLHVFPADHPDQPQCIGKHQPDAPCDGTRGKHPAVKWGTFAVTVTPQTIDLTWAQHGDLANIAISCGPSGLVVLDEDERGEIERWCATYGITLPDTYTVTTDRGAHQYFRWDHTTQRIGNSPKAMDGFKIDVRGAGGFVIGEGSQHASGAIYTGNGLPIADLPHPVAELLVAGRHQQPPDAPDWEDVGGRHDTKLGYHHRHNALIAYAGRLRKSGLDYREAEAVYRERWLLCEQPAGQIPEARFHSTACPSPVTWEEAQAKLRDVYSRYAAAGQKNDTESNGLQPGRSIAVTLGSSVVARKIEFWEQDLIVADAINLLAGREGNGKSTVAASWAARETRSGGTVLWIGTEESREYAVVPRLIAAGADLERVLFVDVEIATAAGNITTTLQFPLDLPAVRQKITDHQVTMMVLDPCKGVVPPDFKGSDDVAVRQYLEPIAKLCSDCRVTMLGLAHFGKRESSDSGLLILGSIAWSQVARSVVSIAEDPDSGTRVLTNTKSNYATRTRSIEFAINSTTIDTADGPAEIGAVEWLGETDKDARDLLGGQSACAVEEFDEHDYTADLKASWLYKYLEAAGKGDHSVRPKDAVAVGADKGISRRSVFNHFTALANAGMAESVDQAGFPRVTHWRLITDETAATDSRAQKTGCTTGTTVPDLQKQDCTTGDTTDPMALQAALQEKLPLTSGNDAASVPVVPVVQPDRECAPEPDAESHICSVCDQELIAPASVERGYCERCRPTVEGDVA